MRRSLFALFAAALALPLATGCGSSFPIPNDQFATAQKDVGRAQESGADGVPDAKLHLQLANETLLERPRLDAKSRSLNESDGAQRRRSHL